MHFYPSANALPAGFFDVDSIKQGPIRHKPWPIQTVADCKNSYSHLRQLQTTKTVTGCKYNCKQMQTDSHCILLKTLHCWNVFSCLYSEMVAPEGWRHNHLGPNNWPILLADGFFSKCFFLCYFENIFARFLNISGRLVKIFVMDFWADFSVMACSTQI